MQCLAAVTAFAALALAVVVPARAGAQEQSLTLSRALEIGRQRSPQLKGARAHVESAVTKATLSQREKLVVIAKGLIKAGLQPPLEEIRALARAEAARLQLATAEADVYDARAVLAALLSLDPAAPLKVAPPRLPRLDM